MSNMIERGWKAVAVMGYFLVIAGAVIYPLQYTALTDTPLLVLMAKLGLAGVGIWTLLCYLISLALVRRAQQQRLNELSIRKPRFPTRRTTSG